MTIDSRLAGKPERNNGSLEIMDYNYLTFPKICENIWHAQQAGWPSILTYDYVSDVKRRRSEKAIKRYFNIDASGVVRSNDSSADEYPFASTVENAGSTFISNVPGLEQRRQGGLIGAFYKKHWARITSGKPFWFEVRVINSPFR